MKNEAKNDGKRGKINGIQGQNDGKRGINTKKHPKKFAAALRAPVYYLKKIAGEKMISEGGGEK